MMSEENASLYDVMMSEESVSLCDLLNLSIGTPHRGAVNFSALHALLHAVLTHLGVRDVKTRWRDSAPGDRRHPDAPVGARQDRRPQEEEQVRQEQTPGRLQAHLKTCEDDVSKAMKLIQDLQDQRDGLREDLKELQDQREGLQEDLKELQDQRESLKENMKELQNQRESLKENMKELQDQREGLKKNMKELQDQRESLKEVLKELQDQREGLKEDLKELQDQREGLKEDLKELQDQQKDLLHSGFDDGASHTPLISTPSPPLPLPVHRSEGPPASQRYPETVGALRSLDKLREALDGLEARVTALEGGGGGATHLTEHAGSQQTSDQLIDQRRSIHCLMSDGRQLLNDVQKTILQLQAESETLKEDDRLRERHIEELLRVTEELEQKKADKLMVESELTADRGSVEQLGSMFHQLLGRLTAQEQDWHRVVDRLTTELERKLNRIELDSVKKQLEGRWRNVHEKLQAQEAPEHEDAAALRKQLVDRFHCLSCDRPVVKYTPGSHVVKLASSPGFPAQRSVRPFTVYALEQFRQHCRSERLSELTDYGHVTAARSCGGGHTVTSAGQRRSGLKLHNQSEDGVTQSEEVDIIGLDGHIYRGRLNAPSVRNTDNKLPTISTRDGKHETGVCKSKERAKSSMSHKAAGSPEGAGPGAPPPRPHSAKSVQCSRSASSSSARDWPVSTLGSVTPAESNTELLHLQGATERS